MLVIRDVQLTALSAAQERAFVDRVATFIASQMDRAVDKGELQRLLERGRRYGLTSEQDLTGYMFVAIISGAGRRDQDPEWIRIIMREHEIEPATRVRTLNAVAKDFWSEALGRQQAS